RILQRYNLLSTAFFSPLSINFIETSSELTEPSNSLIIKEFFVPSAPEEVRIIERLERPSTPNFHLLMKNLKTPLSSI
ncbi:hypothetical protein NLO95_25165, partial [Pseudomonas syringae]|nr:hypothetical protein [Pseudomonas syringae]